MAHNDKHLGWLKYNTETESEALIQEINTCLGFPTADGKTTTWSEPSCLQNDYEGSQTESGWFVIIKDECFDCLSQEQKDNMITELPYYIACGTPIPNPSGDTENYL